MRKAVLILGMALALITIVYSFFAMGDKARFFGYEMNIWVYRLIWFAMFGAILNSYLRESKKT